VVEKKIVFHYLGIGLIPRFESLKPEAFQLAVKYFANIKEA